MADRLRFASAARTDMGLVRRENEDAIAVPASGRLWAVADGMGGHARGAWAAQTVCRALEAIGADAPARPARDAVADVLADANAHILAAGKASGHTVGTTVVVLVAEAGRVACLWAGDSRAYRFRDGALRPLTRDHSQVTVLVQAGLLTEAEARTHPLGNVVTRAVGVAPRLALDIEEAAIAPGDLFLLCSDGLTKCLDDAEIAAMLAPDRLDACADALVAAVRARGAPDNVSLVLVRADGGPTAG